MNQLIKKGNKIENDFFFVMATSKQRVFFLALGFGWLQFSEPLPSAAILTLYLSLMLSVVKKNCGMSVGLLLVKIENG